MTPRESSRRALRVGTGVLALAALGIGFDAVAQTAPPAGESTTPEAAAIGRPEQPSALPPLSGGESGGNNPAMTPPTAAGVGATRFVDVPVSSLIPGDVKITPDIPNPVAKDPQAATRGMQYFNAFNCVGCHAPNGAGGMGPSLSNNVFIHGSSPANIYLTIAQGRAQGMPAWGAVLGPEVIWDLVAYVQSISAEPASGSWGQTVSAATMKTEQVPAEYVQSATPWQHIEAFSNGQKPNNAP